MIKAKNTSFQEERLPQQFLKKKKRVILPFMSMLKSLLQEQRMSSGRENYILLSPDHKKNTKQLLELKCKF